MIKKVKINGVVHLIDYSALENTPEALTKVSELENDADYATVSQIPTSLSELSNDTDYATTAQLPTKVGDLDNDLGFATSEDVSGAVSTHELKQATSTEVGHVTLGTSETQAAKGNHTHDEYAKTSDLGTQATYLFDPETGTLTITTK